MGRGRVAGNAVGGFGILIQKAGVNMNDKAKMEAEIFMEQIRRERRAAGATQKEFADVLGLPVWAMDVLENGVLLGPAGEKLSAMDLMTRQEMEVLRSKLGSGMQMDDRRSRRVTAPDDEMVFYFPVTVSSRALEAEVKALVRMIDASRLTRTAWDAPWCGGCALMMFKIKTYYLQMTRMGRADAARGMLNRFLELIENALK